MCIRTRYSNVRGHITRKVVQCTLKGCEKHRGMEQNGKKVARFARKGGVQRGRATALNLLASEERTVSIFTLFLFFLIIARF